MMGIGLGDPPRIQHSYENGPFILKLPEKKWDSPVHSIKPPKKCRNTIFMYIIFAIYATLYSSLNPVCSFFQGIAIPPYIIAACTRSGWLHFFSVTNLGVL